MSREMAGLGRLAQGPEMGRLTATLWYSAKDAKALARMFSQTLPMGPT